MKFGRRNYRSCTLQCLVYFGQPPSQMEFATDIIFPKPGESTVFEGGRETIVAERLSDWRLPDLGRHRFGALGAVRPGMGSKPMRQPGLLPPGGLRRCVRLLDSVSQGLPLASWQAGQSIKVWT